MAAVTGVGTGPSPATRHPFRADVDPGQSRQRPQGSLHLALAAAAGGTPRLLATGSTAALAVPGQRQQPPRAGGHRAEDLLRGEAAGGDPARSWHPFVAPFLRHALDGSGRALAD